MKRTISIVVWILVAFCACAAGVCSAQSQQIGVVNGDFSDLSGMTPGQGGWYSGLPAGWQGSESTYALQAKSGAASAVCNPSTLGFFRQKVGVLEHASDVVLTFDVAEPWKSGSVLNAAILDGNFVQLATDDYPPGERQELVARQVPAGTSIMIAFQAAKLTPRLDNVSVTINEVDSAAQPAVRPAVESDPPITIACYYFGNYHPGDPRNVKNKGEEWSEWELVKAARPRFPGHHQPNVPLWGYEDESDPKVMARKIAAAADHGIDAFIFDWYYYDDGPFLDRPIDEGFLKAENNSRLKFAFMWANHDWTEIHPYRRGAERKVLYPGKVTPETFEKVCDHVIRSYFSHPSYWRIDGRPYSSFYDLTTLLDGFGSVEATRKALDGFRAKAVAAGLPGLHLNAVVWGRAILPGERKPVDAAQLVKDLGFDSVTSYVWIHHVGLPSQQTDYNEVRDSYFRYWNEAERKFSVPYFPNVTMGWDSSPRAHQDDEFGNFGYPFTNTISGNTPERFQEALAMTKQRLLAKPGGPRILNINCWNEWTEGSYLEPDTVHGMKYLEAVHEVFGSDGAGAIKVSTDFEGGNVGAVERVSETHLRCGVPGEVDQDKRNRQPSWFYFRLDGLGDNELTVDLTDLKGEYNYRAHDGSGLRNMRPVYSYDDRTWHHFEAAEWNPDAGEIRVQLKPTGPRVWIARQPPYTQRHLQALLGEVGTHPHLRQDVVGKSVQGRPIPLLTITNPDIAESGKKVIWLIARQHAWESGTSWVVDGAIRFLLSDAPEAAAIRDRFIWKVFPLPDPDGVLRGGVRFNANGYDLNRNWDVTDERLMPEIFHERKAIYDWVDGGHRIDLFLTMHNTEAADFVQGAAELQPLAMRLWKLLTDGSTFYQPNPPRPKSAAAGGAEVAKGRMDTPGALFRDRRIPAFLMEQMVDTSPRLSRPPTVKDRLEFGPALVKAMCGAVEE